MITQIRKIGGSMTVTIPPAIAKQLNLSVGSRLDVAIHDNVLQLKPAKPEYTLDELLAQSDFSGSPDNEWLDAPAIGKELL